MWVPDPSVLTVRELTLLFLARLTSAKAAHPASYPDLPSHVLQGQSFSQCY